MGQPQPQSERTYCPRCDKRTPHDTLPDGCTHCRNCHWLEQAA